MKTPFRRNKFFFAMAAGFAAVSAARCVWAQSVAVSTLAAPPAAADVFERLEKAEKETSSVSFDFTQRMEFDIQDMSRENFGSAVFKKPDFLRMEIKSPVRQVTVSDGKKLYNYNAATNQFFVSDWKKIKNTGMLYGWPDSFAGDIPALKEKYDLKVVECSSVCVRLALEDKKAGFAMSIEFDSRDMRPTKTQLVSKGVSITTKIFNFTRNAELPKDTFRFIPPKGAEILKP